VRGDTQHLLGIKGWRRAATDRDEWRRRLKEAKAHWELHSH